MRSSIILHAPNLFPVVQIPFRWNSFSDWTLRGTRGDFFKENKGRQKNMKYTWVDSVFYADSKYVINFDSSPMYANEIGQISIKKVRNSDSIIVCLGIFQVASLVSPTVLFHFEGLYVL